MITVLVIVAVLATISFAIWQNYVDYEAADNAKAMLGVLWQSQEEFYSWKNNYADRFNLLTVGDPNSSDKAYTYTIDRADHAKLLIRATRKGRSTGFLVDETGNITAFPPKK
jgi:Tfp pilus assembly protein PilE